MKPNERLRIAIEKLQTDRNYSQADIMRVLKYASPNYLSELMAGNKKITPKFLRKLEGKTFISRKWIETGEGDMLIDITAILDTMINDLYPEWSKEGKAIFRETLKLIAKLTAANTQRPYLECLHDIYGKIDRDESS